MKKFYLFLLAVTVSFASFAQTGGVGCMDETACNYCPWATEDALDDDGVSILSLIHI